MLKILFTCEFYEPSKGGIQEIVKQLAERLVRKGHHVTVATTRLPSRNLDFIGGVHIKSFSIRGNKVRGISSANGEIERYQHFLINGKFDLILNYSAQIWTTDLIFEILDKVPSKKVLVPCGYSGLHNSRYRDYFKKIPDYLAGYDALVYESAHYQDKAFNDARGFSDRALVIPNAASEEEFLGADTFDIKKNLGLSTKYLCISVSNHYRAKGHHFIIDAFQAMKRKDATLLIIGEIPSFGFKHILHAILGCYPWCLLASKFNSNIKVVSGKNRGLVVSAYKNADLFLFGSQFECAPVVMYESFASKTPFITTDVGNVKDHADLLKIVKSPGEMAMIANRLLDHSEEADAVSEKAFQAWRNHYTWSRVADQYESLFKKLVQGD
jgi:L-malate glycosyltransferase